MNTDEVKRKLTTILSADVKGYSRLMGEDEEWTVRTLKSYKDVMGNLIQQHRGRVVDAIGDNLMAEFASVVDAVQSGVEIQQVLRAKNALLPETRRVEFRIGINLGDVIEEGERIYGDGVNIAARLEGLAEAGGICISESAYHQIENKLPLKYEYMGEQQFKNIARPVRVYRAQIEPEAASEKKAKPRQWPRSAIGLVVILIVVVAAVVIWKLYTPPAPNVEVASKAKMALPLPDKPSIAVLPFANMSDDPKQEYFSDGMTEDLITDLSKLSGLLVIARNSTFTYKGKSAKIKQVAEELGVRYVLEGSVRKAGDEVRINAQLIDAMTGHQLWAERYDGKMDRIFALQDQITKKIVSALEVKLTWNKKELGGQRGTDNVAAYDAFLKGWGHYLRLTPTDFAQAASSSKKAIELDPNYVRAYAALALVYWTGYEQQALLRGLDMDAEEAHLRSREYLQKAMREPSSIAYNVSSQMYLWRRQHNEAISELERGLSLDPNDLSCLQSIGWTLSMAGKPKEAIEYINKGMRLDPQNPSAYLVLLGMAHFCMGDLAKATSLTEEALRLNPRNLGIGIQLAAFNGLLGRDQEARATLEAVRKKLQRIPPIYALMWRYPFSDRSVADRYAKGLLVAGVFNQLPGAGARGTAVWNGLRETRVSGQPLYLPAFRANQLTGEQIKALLFGSTMTGVYFGARWWIKWEKNGECTWHGVITSNSDHGNSRIEGDIICTKYQKNWWGIEHCGTVFRNPSGTPETKDEYFFVHDVGFRTFSPVH